MGTIYQNALLTLSALNSTSCDSGCYRTALKRRQAYRLEVVDEEGIRRNVYARERLIHPNGSSAPLSSYREDFPLLSRAWVYQERLLSSRTLYFTSSEMI